MGRRAKKAPVQTKKRVTLSKEFKCPFCANDNVVGCKMDFKGGIGRLDCRLCQASYSMPIHHLHEPIDVFSEWLDDCEAAARPKDLDDDAEQPQYDDGDDDDDIPDNSGLARRDDDDDDGGNQKGHNQSTATAGGQPSYSALGLEDSDSDSDDDE
mmetsp:Transcript_14191/g.20967  ORF Transcript_14191/g.20967 Transcript_14191/m.20967 type:complete len:155 (+) Transcript_14191:152-616(+)|eukprot:CAMPEP_0194225784 /NCGR_PEP_ID=MMETSP0156-20130528/40349_1 /TAXON_ID=33649 /ORGANISM="Thalassionema nitzschioides, Strain L26-B" /LENGTH=154 /DNA_ID=CAMNT_0038957873 /DNA_START=131 /DNA_END=595 /DNA_ORIENTATION=+